MAAVSAKFVGLAGPAGRAGVDGGDVGSVGLAGPAGRAGVDGGDVGAVGLAVRVARSAGPAAESASSSPPGGLPFTSPPPAPAPAAIAPVKEPGDHGAAAVVVIEVAGYYTKVDMRTPRGLASRGIEVIAKRTQFDRRFAIVISIICAGEVEWTKTKMVDEDPKNIHSKWLATYLTKHMDALSFAYEP